MPNLYIDADACPVKEEAIRVATRHGWPVYMVSNQGTRLGVGPNIHSILVGPEFDAADNWIAEHVQKGEICVTSDIQLAARILEKGGEALGPSGRLFTPENIGSALAMRELSAYLREAGEIKGHNPSFTRQDKSNFLQALDRLMAQKR